MSGLKAGLERLERALAAGGNGHGSRHAEQREAIHAAYNALLSFSVDRAQSDAPDASDFLSLAQLLHRPAAVLAWDSPELTAAVRAECRAPVELVRNLYTAVGGGGPDGAGPEEVMVRSTVTPMGRLWRAGHIYGEHEWPEGEHPGWRDCWNKARALHPLLGGQPA